MLVSTIFVVYLIKKDKTNKLKTKKRIKFFKKKKEEENNDKG
jgi:hypothetical protein